MKHQEVLQSAVQIITDYLNKLDEKGIGKSESPKNLSSHVNLEIQSDSCSRQELENDLHSFLNHSIGTLHPSFMNQLFSGLQPWSMAGDLAAMATNSTMATFEASPMATLMERELIKTLAPYTQWDHCEGIMVTGGSNANLVGLLMARNIHHPQIRQTGKSAQQLIAYVSEDAHYSYEKAFNILGLGLANLRKVATNPLGEMDSVELTKLIGEDKKNGNAPFFVGATAGTTVLGAFDSLEDIARVCREEKIWLHVDGAWGGSVLVSKTHRHLMKGIEFADSLGWDHHKMLGMGLVSSFYLTRHRGALLESHHGGGGEYIFHESESGQYDFGKSSLQCGRRADAVKTWFAWKSQGLLGMERHVDRLMENTKKAADLINQDKRFEMLHNPTLLNLCFKIQGIDNEKHYRQIRELIMADGSFMVNIATRKGQTSIRLILAHPNQSEQHILSFLDHLAKASEKIRCL